MDEVWPSHSNLYTLQSIYCSKLTLVVPVGNPHSSLGEKVSDKIYFKQGWTCKRYRKQGRDENMQEDYPTTKQGWKAKTRRLPYTCTVESSLTVYFLLSFYGRVVFLCVFISALFLYILHIHPYLK